MFTTKPTAPYDTWFGSCCYQGTHWEIVNRNERDGTRVTITDVAPEQLRLDAAGLGPPIKKGDVSVWSDYLRRLMSDGVIQELGPASFRGQPCVEVIAGLPHGQGMGDHVFDRIRLMFDLSRGGAPLLFESQISGMVEGALIVPEVTQSVLVEWSSYEETATSAWIPRRMVHFQQEDVYVLASGTTLQMSDSAEHDQSITTDGLPVKRFIVDETHVEIVELSAISDASTRLCEAEFPAGTVVQNDLSGEVHQLTGIGPAVGEALRQKLEPVSSNIDRTNHRMKIWILLAINALGAAALTWAWWTRKKGQGASGANRVD